MDFIVSYQIYNQNRLQASRDIQDQLIQPEQKEYKEQEYKEQKEYKEYKGYKEQKEYKEQQKHKEQQKQQKQKDLAKREEQKFVKNNCCNCGQDPYFCQCSEIIKLITKFKPEKISY